MATTRTRQATPERASDRTRVMIYPRQSILLKLPLLISVILTAIFACTGYFLEKSISEQATTTAESEVLSSFRVYEALWREHTDNLAAVSRVISRTADVRAAFMTNDRATIKDSAGELWSNLSAANALFTVTDGNGKVIANLGDNSPFGNDETLSFLKGDNRISEQRSGFLQESKRLFQVVLTPVYVDATRGTALLNVLVTGFELDTPFLRSLRLASGGSDLIFKLRGHPVASTLADDQTMRQLGSTCSVPGAVGPTRLQANGIPYLALDHVLPGLVRGEEGELCIVRSLASSQHSIQILRNRITAFWLFGLLAAIVATYELVRRTMQPVAVLDKAASEIARGNYAACISITSEDELGRLAHSFNTMCSSLESARAELIQQERLTAVARLATFVVHDLRNPLASLYAGAEMLVDNDLPPQQIKRLARNMYQASRGMMEILGDLRSAARNKSQAAESCLVSDLVLTAWNGLEQRAEAEGVRFEANIPADLQLKVDRPPMERVFHNLLENAIEAMHSGGKIFVSAQRADGAVMLHVEDTGPGIDPELRPILFQPFATKGRTEGLGLGLALSKQTVVANGGDLWADFSGLQGSHFVLRFPIK